VSTITTVEAEAESTTVPLRQAERELNRQLKRMQDGKGEAPAIRAGLSNLVIYCNSKPLAEQVEAEVPAIVAIHPARVILLVHEPDGDDATVTATVHTRLHKLGKGHRAFSEQITLHASGRAADHLPYAVRTLVIGDLPTNLWWAAPQPPAMAGALLYDLSEHADQVLYDSYGWPEPARGMMTTASWLEKFERGPGQGYRVASDLTWRRSKTWRRVIGQALDPSVAPGALESVQELEVEHGPHSVMSAWGLVSWMALCLGWTVTGARVQPGVELDWRFDSPAGVRHVRVRRLADAPRGVRSLRICCHLAGYPGAILVRPEAGDRRLAVVIEGADAAPRTISVNDPPLAELVARQLSDRERDPIFRKSMAVAQVLAQKVLGA
jgi:glucose-6-phosphate dehydrogenase assembly protein OpcA